MCVGKVYDVWKYFKRLYIFVLSVTLSFVPCGVSYRALSLSDMSLSSQCKTRFWLSEYIHFVKWHNNWPLLLDLIVVNSLTYYTNYERCGGRPYSDNTNYYEFVHNRFHKYFNTTNL